MRLKEKTVGFFGIIAVTILVIALLVFGYPNNDSSFLNDFISKLGATGEPNALWFNLIGFVTVGMLLFVFGLSYGKLLNDKLLSILLSLFGLGFAFTAIPIDMQLSNAPVSKAHVVAICLGLAFWLFGLSRLGYNIGFMNAPHVTRWNSQLFDLYSPFKAHTSPWAQAKATKNIKNGYIYKNNRICEQ